MHSIPERYGSNAGDVCLQIWTAYLWQTTCRQVSLRDTKAVSSTAIAADGEIRTGISEASSSTCDTLNRIAEGIIFRHALVAESPEKALNHAMHCAQQDTALPIDITPVLTFQSGACMHVRMSLPLPEAFQGRPPLSA